MKTRKRVNYLNKEEIKAIPEGAEFIMRDQSGEEFICKRIKSQDPDNFIWEDLGYCDLVMIPGDEIASAGWDWIKDDGSMSPPDYPNIIHRIFMPEKRKPKSSNIHDPIPKQYLDKIAYDIIEDGFESTIVYKDNYLWLQNEEFHKLRNEFIATKQRLELFLESQPGFKYPEED